ncbi:hypothetical protein Droror1_Dr00025489 [Drosera rotundifolia]
MFSNPYHKEQHIIQIDTMTELIWANNIKIEQSRCSLQPVFNQSSNQSSNKPSPLQPVFTAYFTAYIGRIGRWGNQASSERKNTKRIKNYTLPNQANKNIVLAIPAISGKKTRRGPKITSNPKIRRRGKWVTVIGRNGDGVEEN